MPSNIDAKGNEMRIVGDNEKAPLQLFATSAQSELVMKAAEAQLMRAYAAQTESWNMLIGMFTVFFVLFGIAGLVIVIEKVIF